MEGLIMTAQLLLGLSILVGLHELGHLLAAKMFGMRVEKYSIGFPPKIWGFQYGETEYSIGAIPLGGFVKISGMIDESLDTKSLSEEPEPWEFRAKPAWQRLVVMMGGIVVNVITGVIIYISLAYSNGESYLSKEEFNKHGLVAYELAEQIGLKTGDRIALINGNDFDKYGDLRSPEVLLGDRSTYTVDRNGELFEIEIPSDFIDRMTHRNQAVPFIDYRFPFTVNRVAPGSAAEEAGLLAGDVFKNIEGTPINYFDELKSILSDNAGKEIKAIVDRKSDGGSGDEVLLEIAVSDDGKIGFETNPLINFSSREFTVGESVARGTEQAFTVVWVNIKAFGKMFRGEVDPRKSLAGPIGIAQMFGGTWNWLRFWTLTGLLSMVLAFMNFLPIPALDGGHVMFLTFEIVSGRKPSDKFLEGAQKVGMILLLGLMVFIIFNDIIKIF